MYFGLLGVFLPGLNEFLARNRCMVYNENTRKAIAREPKTEYT